MSLDVETGEMVVKSCFTSERYFDMETGEKASSESDEKLGIEKPLIKKTKFNVPVEYLKSSWPEKSKKKHCLSTQQTCTLTSKKKVIQLKEVRKFVLIQFGKVLSSRFYASRK
jgi:hypothetical protein